FVPDDVKHLAYRDSPLPIGKGQTISQPYIVAYMAQVLDLPPLDKVLEIGSGCGYNAAVLAQMVSHVYTIEIVEWLAKYARENIKEAGIKNVTVKYDDGYSGWEEKAPFDHVLFTAATPSIPDALKKQLKIGGKLLAPIDNNIQKLSLYQKVGEDDFTVNDMLHVRFVPMTGKVQKK
ncbi:MAG: protein-L-isoaspartate(D-aspartate) O-methyltransferase, partial [Prolixibacteraceae bacterium]